MRRVRWGTWAKRTRKRPPLPRRRCDPNPNQIPSRQIPPRLVAPRQIPPRQIQPCLVAARQIPSRQIPPRLVAPRQIPSRQIPPLGYPLPSGRPAASDPTLCDPTPQLQKYEDATSFLGDVVLQTDVRSASA